MIQTNRWFREQAFIGGEWVTGAQHLQFPVYNPATEAVIAQVALLQESDAVAAVVAASAAQKLWAETDIRQRSAVLRRMHDLLVAEQEPLAELLTAEQGKPIAESRGEVVFAASFFAWFAEEIRRSYGDTIPSGVHGLRLSTIKQPLGVCAAITPWNFPIGMLARKVAPALAAGCSMIVKPAEQTPLSALALAAIAEQAGLPAGLLNIITTNASQTAVIGHLLSTHPAIRLLSFTGSTAVGKLLMQQAAGTLKKLALELGGNAPFIIFADANVQQAVAGLLHAKFRNAGQTCVSANRIFVHQSILPAVTDQLLSAMPSLRLGDGSLTSTTLGPLIDEKARRKVSGLVGDALAKGATLLYQAKWQNSPGYFYPPTILTGVTAAMSIAHEEIFGPVIPLFPFTNDDHVVTTANATPAGLAAYVYTQDLARSVRVSEALEYGMVGINTGLISTTEAPFGGIKQSGFGREGGWQGLEEYQNLKYQCLNID
jgi:succinate-semialdehyde dehydrogenase/glutarate-semialdehyde dehydrogenase